MGCILACLAACARTSHKHPGSSRMSTGSYTQPSVVAATRHVSKICILQFPGDARLCHARMRIKILGGKKIVVLRLALH